MATDALNLNKEILRLSIPAIVSNITVPLLGLCDTAISGHLGSELFLAAIAVGSMMLNVVFWLFGFLRMGTTGMTASAFGATDDREISKVFSRALALGFLIGVALIVMRRPVLWLMMEIIRPDGEVAELVGNYFLICVWEAPSLLATMAVSGWFVGMQSTTWPMFIAISVNVINIIASCVLVFGLHLGFEGVAIGTVSANWIGFAIAVFAALRFRKGKRLLCPVRELVSGGDIRRFFTVNANLFFRSFCIISVSLGMTAAGARLGAATLAVNAVMMQFFTLFSFFMDGFAFSAEAIVGRYFGAMDIGMVRKSVVALMKLTAFVAIVFTILYIFGSGPLTDVMTDEQSVRTGVDDMALWIWLIPGISVWAFIYDGLYIGITGTGKMLLATLSASVIFFVVLSLGIGEVSTSPPFSNKVLWSAFILYLMLRGLILALLWPRELQSAEKMKRLAKRL